MVAKARKAARWFVKSARMAMPLREKKIPKRRASCGCMRPAGSGRPRVRFMRLSMSRSHHWLSAAAPPAQRAVPRSVAVRRTQSNGPLQPSRKPTSVVMRTRKERRAFTSSSTSSSRAFFRSSGRAAALFMRCGRNPKQAGGREQQIVRPRCHATGGRKKQRRR